VVVDVVLVLVLVTTAGVGAEDSVGSGVSGLTTGLLVGRGVKVGFCVGTGTGLSV